MTRSSSGDLRVRHREYFGDLFSFIGSFVDRPVDQQSFFRLEVSPSNSAMFPWLSTISPNFETYSFNSLRFHYVPFCSTSTAGAVILAVDYDPTDVRPQTKVDLMSMEESVRSNAWAGLVHICRSENLRKHGRDKYTDLHYDGTGLSFQQGAVDPSGSAALFRQQFVSTFYATAPNGTVNGAIGELYVEYDVTFSTPQSSRSLVPSLAITRATPALSPFTTFFSYDSETSYSSNMMIDVPTTTSLRLNANLDLALVVMKSEGAGITGAPGITATSGSQYRQLLALSINTSATKSLRMELWTFTVGAQLTLTVGAGASINRVSLNISKVSPDFAASWGASYSD